MQYTICGYQQSEAAKLVDTVPYKKSDGTESMKTIRIDATDLMILRWFAEFYPNMEKAIIDGKEYGWLNHGHVLEELPILDINVKSVNARMKKLVHFGLLEYQKTNAKNGKKGNWSFYRFGARYASLVRSGGQQEDLGQSTDLGLGGQVPYPLGGQPPYKDSTTSNPSTTHSVSERFTPPTRDEVAEYAREKGYTSFPVDRFIAYYESNGWMVGRNKMKSWRASMTNWWCRDHQDEPKGTPMPQSFRDQIERENQKAYEMLGYTKGLKKEWL